MSFGLRMDVDDGREKWCPRSLRLLILGMMNCGGLEYIDFDYRECIECAAEVVVRSTIPWWKIPLPAYDESTRYMDHHPSGAPSQSSVSLTIIVTSKPSQLTFHLIQYPLPIIRT